MEQGYLVEGYRFFSREEAKKAERELAKIRVLNEKLDEDNLQAVKALYTKAVKQQVFETQIGITYLRNLQTHLIAEGELRTGELPLPIQYSKTTWEEEQLRLREDYDAALVQARNDMEAQLEKERERVRELHGKCRTLMIALALTAVMVIGMFAITFTGKNENVLNYKNALVNKYAQWEQELSEREARIREKEAELGIELPRE